MQKSTGERIHNTYAMGTWGYCLQGILFKVLCINAGLPFTTLKIQRYLFPQNSQKDRDLDVDP